MSLGKSSLGCRHVFANVITIHQHHWAVAGRSLFHPGVQFDMSSRPPRQPDQPKAADGDDRWMESASLTDALGIEYHFAPDENAPAIDEAKICAYLRRELNEGLASETEQMIATFRSWHEAWRRLAAEERQR